MAAETFVDVSYRGIALAATTRLTKFGPTTAFLEMAAPMPVGTQLSVATDDGHRIEVEVVRTHELAEELGATGVRVRAQLDGEVASWWHEHESGDDPVIPDPTAKAKVVEEEASELPVGAASAAAIIDDEDIDDEDGDEQEGDSDAGDSDVGASGSEADADGVPIVDDAEGSSASAGRGPAVTQMMSAVELADAIATGGDSLETGAAPASPADDRPTEIMAAVHPDEIEAADSDEDSGDGADSEPTSDSDDSKAKGKRKRRKRRKTRG